MEKQRYEDFWRFISLLAENGVLAHVMLVGSWAEYVYAQSGMLKGFDPNIRTLDIDFLVKSIHVPRTPVSITAIAKEHGYTVQEDYLFGTTKIFTPELMEIEFLARQLGAGRRLLSGRISESRRRRSDISTCCATMPSRSSSTASQLRFPSPRHTRSTK